MKRIRKGIKICRMVNFDFVSCYTNGKETIYKIGKWTKSPDNCGPLAVFDTIEQAFDFMGHECDDKFFFECEYKKSRKKALWSTEFIPYEGDDLYTMPKNCLPKGTVLATKVKLLKKI